MLSPRIYFAAPLFNPRERAFNEYVAQQLEALKLSVFLPQRDGTLLINMLRAGVPPSVAEKRVFQQDIDAMKSCHALVAVLDGAAIDDGVAFEIGFASALGCICVGFQTDVRRALPSGNNPMIAQSLREIFVSEADLLSWARGLSLDWQSNRETA